MVPILARLLLLVPVLWLGACATAPDQRPAMPEDELTQALRGGDCRAAFDRMDTGAGTQTDRRLQVSQICLQTGDFARARRAAAAFLEDAPGHPDADYAAYLHALAGFGEWTRASRVEPEVRIREGRAMAREIANYLRDRPLSEYGDELAPRMVPLREGIATAELALADRARQRGDRSQARARAEYVLQYYPRTQAAADAARMMMEMREP